MSWRGNGNVFAAVLSLVSLVVVPLSAAAWLTVGAGNPLDALFPDLWEFRSLVLELLFAAALGTFVAGRLAYPILRRPEKRAVQILAGAALVPALCFPAAAAVCVTWDAISTGQVTDAGDIFLGALVGGAAAFALPCAVVSGLWTWLYVSPASP